MKLPEYINHFFPEISLDKDSNWNDLKSKIKDHITSLDDNPRIYIQNKIRELWEKGNNIFDLGFHTEYKFGQAAYYEEREAYKSEVTGAIKNIIILLDEIGGNLKNANPSFTDQPIHLNLNKEEILGIITLFINEFSKDEISKERIFRLCAQNFRAKASVKPNDIGAYSKTYYQKVNEKNDNNKILFTQDTKDIVFEKLEKLSRSLTNY